MKWWLINQINRACVEAAWWFILLKNFPVRGWALETGMESGPCQCWLWPAAPQGEEKSGAVCRDDLSHHSLASPVSQSGPYLLKINMKRLSDFTFIWDHVVGHPKLGHKGEKYAENDAGVDLALISLALIWDCCSSVTEQQPLAELEQLAYQCQHVSICG